jgi:hypothetical protein
MKNLALLFLMTASIVFAQYFSESFNGPVFPPPGWTVYNLEGDNSQWEQDGHGPHTQPGCAFCRKTYGTSPAHVPNNDWLVTPRIYPTYGQTTLTFWYRGFDKNQKESLEVWVSRGGNTPQDFMNPATGFRVAAFGIETWDYTQKIISLSSFINQPIYVAFRYCADNPNRHGVFIDDVGGNIPALPYDIGIVEILSPDTLITPTPFVPQATFKNFGTQNSGPFKTKCFITNLQGTQTLYQDSILVNNLNSGEQIGISFREYEISTAGSYRIRFQSVLTNDMNPTNDTMSRVFRVISSTYHDVGVVEILKPAGEITETPVIPRATVKNYGGQNETFQVKLIIKNNQNVVYWDTTTIPSPLPPLTSWTVEFKPWTPEASLHPFEIKAFTLLPTDQNRTNDTATATAWVPQLDAKVITITAPNFNIVEPTISLTPQAIISNRSFTLGQITIPSVFRIEKIGTGNVYSSTRQKNLGFCEDDTVNYETWQTAPGNYKLICKTTLQNDGNPTNDSVVKNLFVPYRDVSPVYIEAPEDTIPLAEFIPRAIIDNYSNYVINTPVELTISYGGVAIYSDTNYVTIFDSVQGMVFFPAWLPPQTGRYEIKFRTIFPYDLVPNNNEISKEFYVKQPAINISLTSIKSPSDTVQAGRRIYPRVRIKNNGNVPFTGSVSAEITSGSSKDVIYNSTVYISVPLMPDEERNLTFAECILNDPGTYFLGAEVPVFDDLDTTDNQISMGFRVQQNVYRDLGIYRVSEPAGNKPIGFLPTQVIVHNYGNTHEEASLLLKIYRRNRTIPTYESETLSVDLSKNESQILYFANWAADTGTYIVRCTLLLEDNNSNNNYRDTIVTVQAPSNYGWSALAPISSNYLVKDGGALTYLPNKGIYALIGNRTKLFFSYDIQSNTWTRKQDLPYPAGKGAALCSDGESKIYAIVGNKTYKFLIYDIETNSWSELSDVPARAPNERKEKPISAGAGLTFVRAPNGNFVYFVKGNNTTHFFRFNVATNTWDTLLTQIPLGPTGRAKIGDGSSITTDGQYFVYLLKNKIGEFFAYDVTSDSWMQLTPITIAAPYKNVGKGAAIVYNVDNLYPRIYALKGNSYEFWCYDIITDRWVKVQDITNTPFYQKKVGAGGALTSADGVIYALKGNNTPDFFRYKPDPNATYETRQSYTDLSLMTTTNEKLSATSHIRLNTNIIRNSLHINYQLENASSITLKIYNNSGALVKSINYEINSPTGTIAVPISKMPAGVYFLKMETEDYSSFSKIIIQR